MRAVRSRGLVAVGVLVGVVVIVVASAVSRPAVPFEIDSAAPDGMKALRLLLESEGVPLTAVDPGSERLARVGAGTTVYVPRPELLSRRELRQLLGRADAGAVVIYGSPPPVAGHGASVGGLGGAFMDSVGNAVLVEQPAVLVAPQTCDLPELSGLGRIDAVVAQKVGLPPDRAPGLPRRPVVRGRCYGSLDEAHFVELAAEQGRMFVLSSPYLWVNARLQPAKETGGKVTDNAATALRLLTARPNGGDDASAGPRVLVVRAVASADSLVAGTKGPLELLPVPFKGMLLALGVAGVVFVWSRAVRLGGPVDESAEVRVNSSELTAAVARLLGNDPAYLSAGAATLQRRARADCAAAVGVPVTTDPETLCRLVAARSGRNPASVHEVLFGPVSEPTPAGVLDLESRLEQLRTETGNVHSG